MARATNAIDRARSAFRKTFGTTSGQFVLMYLYERCFGKQPTFPASGNALELARNEGMRDVWLIIMEQLREEDMEIRKMYEDYISEKLREEIHQ